MARKGYEQQGPLPTVAHFRTTIVQRFFFARSMPSADARTTEVISAD
jgi:hypothetical protein